MALSAAIMAGTAAAIQADQMLQNYVGISVL
jgi:hypothetical protein